MSVLAQLYWREHGHGTGTGLARSRRAQCWASHVHARATLARPAELNRGKVVMCQFSINSI